MILIGIHSSSNDNNDNDDNDINNNDNDDNDDNKASGPRTCSTTLSARSRRGTAHSMIHHSILQ